MVTWKDNWNKEKVGSSVASLLGGIGGAGLTMFNLANPDNDALNKQIENDLKLMEGERTIGNTNSLDELLTARSKRKLLKTNYSSDDFYNGPSDSDILTGALGSGTSLASAGSLLGPLGAAGGFVLGTIGGIVSGLTGKNTAQEAAQEAAKSPLLSLKHRKKEAGRASRYFRTEKATWMTALQ
jgi:hypothetical protein